MRSTLDELNNELRLLKIFVQTIENINNYLYIKDKKIHIYHSVRSRFDRAAFNVSLYKQLEKFIENIVESYAEVLFHSIKYAELPIKLQKSHFKNSLDILSRHDRKNSHYSDVNELEYIKNLYNCLKNEVNYALNTQALSLHDRNIRTEVINEIFSPFGIDKIFDKACKSNTMKRLFCKLNNITYDDCDYKTEYFKNYLDNIVERRNQVTHHARLPDDELITVQEMRKEILFIKFLSKAIYSEIVAKYLCIISQNENYCFLLNLCNGKNIYKHNHIVIIDKPKQNLHIDQIVFSVSEMFEVRWGRITSIQINGVDKKEISQDTIANDGIGLGLSFRYPQNTSNVKFYALGRKDILI